MAAEVDFIRYMFTGVEGEVIPQNATHFSIHESVTVIPARLFQRHPNIVELICHDGVKRIEGCAFLCCPRLMRVIIPGVEIVEGEAFGGCKALVYVECPELERIEAWAFYNCKSLSSITLPSAKIVESAVFECCTALMDANFGKHLESIGRWAFYKCPSLERVTITLKNGLTHYDNTFQCCVNLKSVDLVEEAVLREFVATLLLEEWRKDMNEEINSINQILPNARAGGGDDIGGKAIAIREWITSVRRKLSHYKAHHGHLLNVAATSLKHALPDDIVMNRVLPFLQLPLHAFGGEDFDEGEDGSDRRDDE